MNSRSVLKAEASEGYDGLTTGDRAQGGISQDCSKLAIGAAESGDRQEQLQGGKYNLKENGLPFT